MLVLTRKCQEKIQIGDNITITIVRVKGQSVRVGIEAPREMKVMRTELPPEAPNGDAAAESADVDEKAGSQRRKGEQANGAESPGDGHDCTASFRGNAQPLSQYIPGTRMLTMTCAG